MTAIRYVDEEGREWTTTEELSPRPRLGDDVDFTSQHPVLAWAGRRMRVVSVVKTLTGYEIKLQPNPNPRPEEITDVRVGDTPYPDDETTRCGWHRECTHLGTLPTECAVMGRWCMWLVKPPTEHPGELRVTIVDQRTSGGPLDTKFERTPTGTRIIVDVPEEPKLVAIGPTCNLSLRESCPRLGGFPDLCSVGDEKCVWFEEGEWK